MDAEQIYNRVIESANRFGPGNQQEFRSLGSQLAKCRPEDVFSGLLLVFTRSEPGAHSFHKQELAGRLLEKMKPKVKFDLAPTIRAVLPAYDPSIEQLPYHFALIHGKEAVLDQLAEIEKEELGDRARACLETMKWWLSGNNGGARA